MPPETIFGLMASAAAFPARAASKLEANITGSVKVVGIF